MSMLSNIQVLRALAVIFVIFYHIKAVNDKYFPAIKFDSYFSKGSGGVDLFFVISGFIIAYISRNYVPSITAATSFLFKRLLRIYPVYWVYSIAVLIVYIAYPTVVNSSQNGEVNLVYSFLLIPHDLLPLLMVGWSLSYEVYFYIIFAVLIAFLPWRLHRYFYLSYFMLISAYIYTNRLDYSENFVMNPFIIEFLLGTFCANLYVDKLDKKLISSSFLMPFMSIAIIFTLYFATDYSEYQSNLYRLVFFGTPSFLLVYLALILEDKSRRYQKNYLFTSLVKIGNFSYSIYLCHILVINFVGIIFSLFFDMSSLFNTFLQLGIMLIGTILIGGLSHTLLERKMCNSIYNFFIRRNQSE